MKKINLIISLCAIFLLFFAGISGDNNPNQFNYVGSILKNGKEYGTCVLISDKYVLVTASYFIECKTKPEPLKGTSVITYAPYDQKITNIRNIQVEINGKTYACKKLILYPVFKKSIKESNCNIAIVELQNSVEGVTPAAIYTNQDEQRTKVIAVNYSPTDVSKKSVSNDAENLIDSLGGYKLDGKPTTLIASLNMPILNTDKLQGDGILFAQTPEGWQLTGIGEAGEYHFSTTNGGMSMKSISWTRVSVFADWIKKTISEN